MVSLTARIALLAYLIGGMAVPAFHRHGSELHAVSHQSSELAICGSAHEHHCGSELGELADTHSLPAGQEPAAAFKVGDQECCSDDCVVCTFSHSAQRITMDAPVSQWGDACVGCVVDATQVFISASDLSISVPRGPPMFRSALG